MKAIVIEDENSAVDNLKYLLDAVAPDVKIAQVIDTVSDAVELFEQQDDFDLIFMDIHLADGHSFEIFQQVVPSASIIFTTAYDQYAIQAFKFNSIDYLLKPIQEEELKKAIEKFRNQKSSNGLTESSIQKLLSTIESKPQKFRQSYLVQKGDKLLPILTHHFAFFFIQSGVVRGTTKERQTYHLDGKLEDVEKELNPKDFFRANRQFLVQRAAIQSLSIYFNGRLIVNTSPESPEQIIVSKANAPKLKNWLNQG
ncbi:MAG: LytTR family DNA-binding domain-containing protein [Bacteroidota bacterium]